MKFPKKRKKPRKRTAQVKSATGIVTRIMGESTTSLEPLSTAPDVNPPSSGPLSKPTRYRNANNLKRMRQYDCFVCGYHGPNDPDHIQSVGAGGGDQLENINTLCRRCHIIRHSIGIKRFIERYYSVITQTREKLELPEMYLPHLD